MTGVCYPHIPLVHAGTRILRCSHWVWTLEGRGVGLVRLVRRRFGVELTYAALSEGYKLHINEIPQSWILDIGIELIADEPDAIWAEGFVVDGDKDLKDRQRS